VSACADGFGIITVTPPDAFVLGGGVLLECLAEMGEGGVG